MLTDDRFKEIKRDLLHRIGEATEMIFKLFILNKIQFIKSRVVQMLLTFSCYIA